MVTEPRIRPSLSLFEGLSAVKKEGRADPRPRVLLGVVDLAQPSHYASQYSAYEKLNLN